MMSIVEVAKAHNWDLPTICPRCGQEFIVNDSGFPECMNEECPAKIEHQFSRFFSILGVKAAGPAFIEKAAYDCHFETDSFKLLLKYIAVNDFTTFIKWAGGINGEKILKQLREYVGSAATKTVTTAELCAMFDWPHLSVKQFKKVYDLTVQNILNGYTSDRLKIYDGISDGVADEMAAFFSKNKDRILELSKYFSIEDSDDEEKVDEDLPTICFTGACPGYSRTQLTEMCRGKYAVVNSVTKDTSILACEDPSSGSSKLQKAAKNGTKIVSYEELLKEIA